MADNNTAETTEKNTSTDAAPTEDAKQQQDTNTETINTPATENPGGPVEEKIQYTPPVADANGTKAADAAPAEEEFKYQPPVADANGSAIPEEQIIAEEVKETAAEETAETVTAETDTEANRDDVDKRNKKSSTKISINPWAVLLILAVIVIIISIIMMIRKKGNAA